MYYQDALDFADSIEGISSKQCPHCDAEVADGLVFLCLGSRSECPNEQTEEFNLDAQQPLDFTD